jgi:large subunit ribosomal protein L18
MRRRREGLTDYHQRLRLLKSGKPRLVARPTNNHVIAQVVRTGPEGDRTTASAHSRDLADFGWEAPTGNLPSAYLTGLLAGKRALAAEEIDAVLDIGLKSATPGSKVFAVQEGAIDAGLDVPHSDSVLPEWSRDRGEHIAEYAESLEKPLYSGDFDATELPEHFDTVRETIMNDGGDQ